MNEQKKIFENRDYQQNIIDYCIRRNSIVYLPTGAGKTYIAIQVLKKFSHQLHKKYSDDGKRSFFLVNTVALAKQQAETIRKCMPYNVCVLTGEDNVDSYSRDVWLSYLDENEVFVMTAQCFADAVYRTFIRLDSVNVIIFDECHHARKGHVYRQIMQSFESCEKSQNIKIVCLSGMLIGIDNSTKPHTVQEELRQLESVYQSTIITVNNINDRKNVLIYSTKAKEYNLNYELTPTTSCLVKVLRKLSVLQDYLMQIKLDGHSNINPKTLRENLCSNKIKELQNMLKDFEYQTGALGNYGSYLGLLSILIQLELAKRAADSAKFRSVVKVCITNVESCIKFMVDELGFNAKNSSKVVLENSSNKVQKLLLMLKKFYNNPNREKDMQCLIFTERRSSAKIIYHLIKCFGVENEAFPIKPDFVVGRNSAMAIDSIETIISNSNNTRALERFEQKETNCIVCTNVLEEGIDLQACNVVIVFDQPKTLRSYVQSRGRARDDKSSYIVMLESSNTNKFKNKLCQWNAVNEAMKNALIGKTIDREPPNEEEIKNERAQVWEPFYTKENARLTALNCISLLCQYAQSLPCDNFTKIAIQWSRIDLDDGKFCVNLRLPTQSMINKVIYGEPRETLKIAKQDAAFKACKELYYIGALTEQLTPVDSSIKIEQLSDTYFDHWKKYENDIPKRAGTKNNRRFHNIRVPKALLDCGPSVGTNYLYRITIKPKFDPENNPALRIFQKLLDSENTFGILTSKRIPRICKMPLFQSYGEIECELSSLPTTIEVEDDKKLKSLRKFHVNIFRDILKAFQNFFVLDKTSYLIVPLNCFNEISWELVDTFQTIPEPKRLSRNEIESMNFKAEDYLYKVINPVYRESRDQNYVVVNVNSNKTPLSQFPEKAQTYQDYFKEKYNLNIYRQDQFLVEVKGISKNLKLFFPGCGISGRQRKYERLNECEEYIPEICHNYQFPGDYWLKATLLPSICHRIFYMLLAEELRCWLINEKIDSHCGQQVYKLDIDYTDYDQRAEISNRTYDSPEKLEEFPDILKAIEKKNSENVNAEKRSIKALASTDYKVIDLDRNWTSVTEVDIDYYFSVIGGKLKTGSSNKKNPIVSQKKNPAKLLAIKNEESSKNINMLALNSISSCVQQKDLLKVLTTANAGDVFDMERYETLGDAFLKFIVSLYIYKHHAEFHEGYLTALKGKLVSNRNLFYVGNDFGLSQMLKASQYSNESHFAPSTKLPTNVEDVLKKNKNLLTCLLDVNSKLSDNEVDEGIMENMDIFNGHEAMDCEEEEGIDKTLVGFLGEQYIGDKVVADSVEAFIGCVISSVGIQSGVKLCKKLKILPEKENFENDLLTESIQPRLVFESDLTVTNQALLEKKIKYKFNNSVYLTQALTHASYPNKVSGTYQQLEFLGDAVLDFLITSFISEQCPKMSPGQLTDLRSALVNNVTLACIIVRNDIHKHMMFESRVLTEAISNFVNFQESQNHEVTDQILLMKTDNDTTIAKSIEVPKALGDIFESIIGAVYLDAGLSLQKTWDVIYELMKNEIQKFTANVPLQIIRRLFEFQFGRAEPKFYKTELIDGDDNVAVPLKIKNRDGNDEFVIGFGKNRKMAKEAAAKKALIALSSD